MELVKKQIHANQVGKKMVDQFLVDDDFNVPDTKNDVQRVVAGEGTVKIEDVRPVENYVRVTEKLYFQILYVTEGAEPSLTSMEGKIPFEEMVYADEGTDGEFVVQNTRVDFTATMIHSRKLNIKAMIELLISPQMQVDEDITVDVESEMPLYKKKKAMELLTLHTSKKDTYRIKEELTLPGTKETIGTVLWTDISNRKLDTKLGADELLLSGELLAFCFYESPDGKIDWIGQTIPYEGRVECYGVDEAMYHHLNANLEDINVDIRMDEDGEMRTLGIEGTLELKIAIYQEENIDFLEDVYSLEQHCRLETKEASYEELLMQNHSKCKIAEQLSLPELKDDILQICHSSGRVQIDRTEVTEEGVQIDGVLHVSFLFVKPDDEVPFDTWQGMVPFSYLVESNESEMDMHCDITSALEQLSVSLMGGDSVEVKAVLAFHSFLRKSVKADVITDLKMEKISMEELEKRPGIVGYIVKEGDDLWTLAKRYSTTKEGIMEVNEMTDEMIKPGDRILIFKENMSIL